MPNLYDMCSATRTRLGDPRAQSPGDAQLLQQICTHVRTLLRFKRNTSNPWNFADTYVDITPGEGVYQINAADFGTPLAVISHDPSNPNHIPRLIPFYCPQNMHYSYGLPNNAGSWPMWWNADGSNTNALRCSIYWNNNLPYIEFLPVPQLSPASYAIRYLQSANQVGQLSLDAQPLQPEDCDLAEIRAAQSLLSTAEWWTIQPEKGETLTRNEGRICLLRLPRMNS